MIKLIKLILAITVITAIIMYGFEKKTKSGSTKEVDFKNFSTKEELGSFIEFKSYNDLKEVWGLGEIGEPWDASGIGELKMRVSVKWENVKCMGKSVKINFDNDFTDIKDAVEKNPGKVNAYELYDSRNNTPDNNTVNNVAQNNLIQPDTFKYATDKSSKSESSNADVVTERNTYNSYLTLIKERRFSELKKYYSEVLEVYMNKENIPSEIVVNDAIKYSTRWDMVEFNIISFEPNSNREYNYHTIIKLQSLKNKAKLVSFDITGIIAFDLNGKIKKLKDVETKKIYE